MYEAKTLGQEGNTNVEAQRCELLRNVRAAHGQRSLSANNTRMEVIDAEDEDR